MPDFRDRLVLGRVHPPDLGGLGVGELRPAYALAATGTRDLQTLMGPLPDEIALKLGEHPGHLKEGLAHTWRCRRRRLSA